MIKDSSVVYDDPFQGTRVLYRKNGPSLQPGIENSTGLLTWLPPRSELSSFCAGRAVVEVHIPKHNYYESRTGVVDLSGEWVIEKKYHHISDCGGGRFFAATSDDDFFLLDRNGSIVRQFGEDMIPGRFNEGLLMVCKISSDLSSTQYSYVNMNGEIIIPGYVKPGIELDFRNGSCHNGLIRFFHEGKYGYVDSTGEIVIPCIYDFGTHYSDNRAVVKKCGKYGFIDQFGKIRIPFCYDEAFPFIDGFAPARLGHEWGVIDNEGNIVVSFEYPGMIRLRGRLLGAKRSSKWGVIDAAGNVVLPFEYDGFIEGELRRGEIIFIKEGQSGLVDRYNGVAIEPRYKTLQFYHQGLFYFEQDDICGILDRAGNRIESEEIWGTEKYPIG